MILNTEGIVLKCIDYGESHRIIHLLTPQYGKISAIAMGAKKTKSKFSATTQPLMLGCFVLFKKDSSLGRLNHSEILKSFPQLRKDLLLSTYSMYLADLTDRVLEENEEAQPVYQLLTKTLDLLEKNIHDPEILARIYEIKLFDFRGYRPHFDSCIHCNHEEPQFSYRFSISLGGFLCEKCKAEDPNSTPISSVTAKLLRIFQYIDLDKIGKISISEAYREELEQTNRKFIEEHFGLKLKWFSILRDYKNMYDM